MNDSAHIFLTETMKIMRHRESERTMGRPIRRKKTKEGIIFVFSFSFFLNMIIEMVWGHRVTAKVELEGLDMPEMGALGYPEFALKPEPVLAD